MSSVYLNDLRHNVTSQNGEDGVLSAIFEAVGKSNCWCCEFGAWDGKYLSNTHSLIDRDGWSAVLIEGDKAKAESLARSFKANPKVTAVCAFVSEAGESSLDQILRQTAIPEDFDLLSIDIDNNDYFVWAALERYQPRVVVIEVNSSVPPGTDKLPSADFHPARAGTSFSSTVALGKSKGYELALHTGNCIFVRRELASKLAIDPEHPEELFDPTWLALNDASLLRKVARRVMRFARGA